MDGWARALPAEGEDLLYAVDIVFVTLSFVQFAILAVNISHAFQPLLSLLLSPATKRPLILHPLAQLSDFFCLKYQLQCLHYFSLPACATRTCRRPVPLHLAVTVARIVMTTTVNDALLLFCLPVFGHPQVSARPSLRPAGVCICCALAFCWQVNGL